MKDVWLGSALEDKRRSVDDDGKQQKEVRLLSSSSAIIDLETSEIFPSITPHTMHNISYLNTKVNMQRCRRHKPEMSVLTSAQIIYIVFKRAIKIGYT